MNTRLLLMAEFNTALIPVERIAKPWFGISYPEARKRIRAGKFPVAAIQVEESEKAPWFLRIEDMADYIDQKAEAARNAKQSALCLLQKVAT